MCQNNVFSICTDCSKLLRFQKLYFSTVLKILKKSPDLINTTKADGYTPLHVAAINDNTDVIQVLLKVKLIIISETIQNKDVDYSMRTHSMTVNTS